MLEFSGANPADTTPLYSCLAGSDQFLSLRSDCENQTVVRQEGWLYTSPPFDVSTVALYRCVNGGEHFAALDPNCEGAVRESRLGYLLTEAALNRYFLVGVDHWVTTGAIPNGYSREGTLGSLVASAPGATPLFGCLAGQDQFVSSSSTCEGQRVIGVEGYVYGSPPAGRSTRAIYRCTTASGGEHFVSGDIGCEGQISESRLGYVDAAASLTRYIGASHHWVSTGNAPTPDSTIESSLGWLPQASVPGSAPVFGCHAGENDQFLSRRSDCEGQVVLRTEGWLYTSPSPDTGTTSTCPGGSRTSR